MTRLLDPHMIRERVMSSTAYIGLAVCLAFLAVGPGCKSKIAGGKADGAKIFAEACAKCHGSDGAPSAAMKRNLRVKDLTDPALQARLTDAEIRKQIHSGSSNHLMPAFGDNLTKEQLDVIVKYVRTLKR